MCMFQLNFVEHIPTRIQQNNSNGIVYRHFFHYPYWQFEHSAKIFICPNSGLAPSLGSDEDDI